MSHLDPPEQTIAGARQVEHTADLALELWGRTEAAMLEAGAQAVVAVMTDGADVAGEDLREVDVEAIDAEDRLVRWLNEVLYWASVEGFVLARAELQCSPSGVRGRAWGREHAADLLRTEIKAATYHDLHVVEDADRVVARVVLDV